MVWKVVSCDPIFSIAQSMRYAGIRPQSSHIDPTVSTLVREYPAILERTVRLWNNRFNHLSFAYKELIAVGRVPTFMGIPRASMSLYGGILGIHLLHPLSHISVTLIVIAIDSILPRRNPIQCHKLSI